MNVVSVLIVEDEALIALEMQSNLESMGYKVVGKADNGLTAIALSKEFCPDIILMDIRLKGEMDGIDAAIKIRKQQDIPIVFLTAFAEEEKLQRAKKSMPFGYLLKPVQDRDLKVTIEMALNNARAAAERKKMEQELRISNLFLDSVLDQNPTAIWISDETGTLIRINRACLKLFNTREDEILGKYNILKDSILKKQGLIEKIETVFKKGDSIRFEIEYDISKIASVDLSRATKIYLDVFIYPIRDPEGEITNVVVQNFDITKRKQIEKERFRLAEEFKRTVQGLPNQVFRYHLDDKGVYRVSFSEGRMAEESGITTEQIIGQSLEDVMGIENADLLNPHFKKAFNGIKVNYELLVENKWFNTTLIPFELDNDGNVIEIIGFSEDITLEKQAAEAYQASQTRFKILAELAPIGIYLTDESGKCVYVNQRWCEMAGLSQEEALGDGWKQGIYLEDQEQIYRNQNETLAKGGIWQHEHRFKNQNGEIIWVLGLAKRITDSDGNTTGFMGVNLDINDRKRTEEFLRNAQRELEEEVERRTIELKLAKDEAEIANSAKSEFLANISHELRNPMHQILSYSKYGLDKIDHPKPKLHHYFKQIRTSASRLMALLNDLLDLSKMESGRMDYKKSVHNIRSIILEVVDELNPSIKEKQLEIEIENQDYIRLVFCDNFKIAQVVRNLLANSIKFSAKGTKIIINMSDAIMTINNKQLPSIQVSVGDFGIGVPNAELNLIFDKFSQSSNTKTGAGGTGLGLAICKEIIIAHQGRIWAEHNKPKGVVFKFILPISKQVS